MGADWPVIGACIALLPAAVTAAWVGTLLHRRDVTRGIIAEEA